MQSLRANCVSRQSLALLDQTVLELLLMVYPISAISPTTEATCLEKAFLSLALLIL